LQADSSFTICEKVPVFAIGGLGRQSDATQDIGETRIAAQSVELRIYFNIHQEWITF